MFVCIAKEDLLAADAQLIPITNIYVYVHYKCLLPLIKNERTKF